MDRTARMSINSTPEQRKKVFAVAKKHRKDASEVVRMCVDLSLPEVDRRLAEMAKPLAVAQ